MKEAMRELKGVGKKSFHQSPSVSRSSSVTAIMEISGDEEEAEPWPRAPNKRPRTVVDKPPPIRESDNPSMDYLVERIAHEILGRVGNLVNARFATLEDRLLPEEGIRPPLSIQAQMSVPRVPRQDKRMDGSQKQPSQLSQRGPQLRPSTRAGTSTYATAAAAAVTVGKPPATKSASAAKTAPPKEKAGPKTGASKMGQGPKQRPKNTQISPPTAISPPPTKTGGRWWRTRGRRR